MNEYSPISSIHKHRFDPTQAVETDIDILDIAHALSMLSRANGHFWQFYSVAQHSINCAMEADARGYTPKVQLACLLHDASEAYIGDLTRPLKQHLPEFERIEHRLQATIFRALDVPVLSESEQGLVHLVDDSLLYHEFVMLHGDKLFDTEPELARLPDIKEYPHRMVEDQFLSAYYWLKELTM
ncbi:MAG: phosphohydrolase [Oscillospiraceae bacterium]|jgi:hypothetical protein